MVMHEIFGVVALAITGVILVSALNPNAATAKVIGASFTGLTGVLGAISAPVSGAAAGHPTQ